MLVLEAYNLRGVQALLIWTWDLGAPQKREPNLNQLLIFQLYILGEWFFHSLKDLKSKKNQNNYWKINYIISHCDYNHKMRSIKTQNLDLSNKNFTYVLTIIILLALLPLKNSWNYIPEVLFRRVEILKTYQEGHKFDLWQHSYWDRSKLEVWISHFRNL